MNAPPPYAAPPSPPKKGFPTWAIVLLVLLGLFFVIGPIVGVLAIYGVRRYLANAKEAEARNAVGMMARDAAEAYAKDHRLCPSASVSVPASARLVKGMKYQSSPQEWEVDRAHDAGFACIGFSMDMPQYYQYSYTATPTSFSAIAHGDLNGDGVMSTFMVRGTVTGDEVTVNPSIEVSSPDE